MLTINPGFKQEGLCIASISGCQTLTDIVNLCVHYLLNSPEQATISNCLDFFNYWELVDSQVCEVIKQYNGNLTVVTKNHEVVDFLIKYWGNDNLVLEKKGRVFDKESLSRLRSNGYDVLTD